MGILLKSHSPRWQVVIVACIGAACFLFVICALIAGCRKPKVVAHTAPPIVIPDCLVAHWPCTDAGWAEYNRVINADQLGNRSLGDLADEINAPIIADYRKRLAVLVGDCLAGQTPPFGKSNPYISCGG